MEFHRLSAIIGPKIAPKLKLNRHLTKSPKRDHICKLCFYSLEEHKCLKLTS